MEIIVGETSGFCYGVKSAVNGANKILEKEIQDVYCLGEIVHNKQVTDNLSRKGLIFIENIEEAKGLTIIRAHGVEKEVYEKAKKCKIEIADFTCPNVLKIHRIAEQYSDKGYYIFLCGSNTHPENIGTTSFCGKHYSVIDKKENLERVLNNFKKSKLKKLLLISQTTYSMQKFNEIEKTLIEQLPSDVEFVVKNTICYATEQRQKETSKLSKIVDLMIIIGGKNSSNTKKLYEIANQNCENTICIETKGDLDINYIIQFDKIGIMAGASTPQESVKDVVSKIESILPV